MIAVNQTFSKVATLCHCEKRLMKHRSNSFAITLPDIRQLTSGTIWAFFPRRQIIKVTYFSDNI